MGVLASCKPRKEVLKGDLDDAIFAADFGDLIDGSAPSVYKDAKSFFQNTHPAKPLCSVARRVFERLAAPKEAGAFVRLSTGFGGGKTHTLMAFWHLANISPHCHTCEYCQILIAIALLGSRLPGIGSR